jgi:hypothetical protein
MFTALPAGKLFNDTLKSTVFFTVSIVMTAVPRAVDSAFVIGGTSFRADSCTVKIFVVLGDVGVLLLLPHPAAPIARTVTAIASFLIPVLLVSQYVKSVGQREDDCESDRAGIEIRHVQNFRLKLKPM